MFDEEYRKRIQTKKIEDKIRTIKLNAKEIVDMVAYFGTGSIDGIKGIVNDKIDTFAEYAIEQVKKIKGE